MISWTNNKQPEVVAPGYVYFRDNGMDYKIGITKDMVQRGAAYKTENPRDTVLDFIEVQDMNAARFIESKLKDGARSRDLLSFQNSGEWLKRVPESVELWKEISIRSASRSEAEWLKLVDSLNAELADVKRRLEQKTKDKAELQKMYSESQEKMLNHRQSHWIFENKVNELSHNLKVAYHAINTMENMLMPMITGTDQATLVKNKICYCGKSYHDFKHSIHG